MPSHHTALMSAASSFFTFFVALSPSSWIPKEKRCRSVCRESISVANILVQRIYPGAKSIYSGAKTYILVPKIYSDAKNIFWCQKYILVPRVYSGAKAYILVPKIYSGAKNIFWSQEYILVPKEKRCKRVCREIIITIDSTQPNLTATKTETKFTSSV